MRKIFFLIQIFNSICIFNSPDLFAKEAAKKDSRKPASIQSFDGFSLPYSIELPAGTQNSEVNRVIVFIAGSGPVDMDGDFSDITVPPGSKNLAYKDISSVLLKKGFATLRFNKRAFEVSKKLKEDPKYKKSKEFKKLSENPLKITIKDAAFFTELAKREFPNAKVYILGHSEGTMIALNVAQSKSFISGVALIGFTSERLTTTVFEQIVYRPNSYFSKLDKDHDGIIDTAELNDSSDLAKSIKSQMPLLDLNQNGKLDYSEYMAGNYSNLLVTENLQAQKYSANEAVLPRSANIVKDAKFKILFLAGEWDNQTPAYQTKAVQIANQTVWKKKNLNFVYFSKAGHILDIRESLEDLNYQVLSPEVLDKVSVEIESFLK